MAVLGSVAVLAIVGAVGFGSQRNGAPASASPLPPPRTELDAASPSDPRAVVTSPGPRVAVLTTHPGANSTSLYLPRAGEAAPGAPVATFTHLEDAAVSGAVLPGTAVVLATADTVRDASFAATLLRVAPHRPAEPLVDRVVHASRPLVTAAGRVFVSRGTPGPDGRASLRADSLTVDEVDPTTGAAHTVHATSGYVLQLAGTLGRELFVYRVGPAGADLVAVDTDSGAVRTVLAQLLPYARDFSVDTAAGALVFQERDETDSRAYVLERVDLVSGVRRRLYTSTSPGLSPFAWPGGGVAYSHEGRDGLALLGGSRPLPNALLGPGIDVVQATSADGTWVAGIHTVPGHLPVAFAVDTRAGTAAWLTTPADARATVAGFVTDDDPAR